MSRGTFRLNVPSVQRWPYYFDAIFHIACGQKSEYWSEHANFYDLHNFSTRQLLSFLLETKDYYQHNKLAERNLIVDFIRMWTEF